MKSGDFDSLGFLKNIDVDNLHDPVISYLMLSLMEFPL